MHVTVQLCVYVCVFCVCYVLLYMCCAVGVGVGGCECMFVCVMCALYVHVFCDTVVHNCYYRLQTQQ